MSFVQEQSMVNFESLRSRTSGDAAIELARMLVDARDNNLRDADIRMPIEEGLITYSWQRDNGFTSRVVSDISPGAYFTPETVLDVDGILRWIGHFGRNYVERTPPSTIQTEVTLLPGVRLTARNEQHKQAFTIRALGELHMPGVALDRVDIRKTGIPMKIESACLLITAKYEGVKRRMPSVLSLLVKQVSVIDRT